MELADEPVHGAWRVLAQLKEQAGAAVPDGVKAVSSQSSTRTSAALSVAMSVGPLGEGVCLKVSW